MSKYHAPATVIAFTADVDLSGSQYQMVKASSTAGNVQLCGTAAASAIGVLQNDPKAGEEASVLVFGPTLVSANAESAASPLVYGGQVKCASDGRAAGMLNPAASSYSVGYALEALASGCGVKVEIFFTGPRRAAG